MDPIGRHLNSEERAILTVLMQEGRGAGDRTASGVAMSLERGQVDVAGALSRLERDGLVTNESVGGSEPCWQATSGAAQAGA